MEQLVAELLRRLSGSTPLILWVHWALQNLLVHEQARWLEEALV